MKYRVYIDDNFHYMDDVDANESAAFETCSEALAYCKKIVDESLSNLLPNSGNPNSKLNATELYTYYVTFGDDPRIVSDDAGCSFSAWDYAKLRCEEIAG